MTKKAFKAALQKIIGEAELSCHDLKLYEKAFTHTSYANEHHTESNERLEFIGDAILDFLVGEYLFDVYPEMTEGDLTKTRAVYVCAEANESYALKLGLDKLLMLGKGEEEQGGRKRQNVLADLFEAFLGAVYLDTHSVASARKILARVVFPSISVHELYLHDYKSELQEMIQAENRKSVTYLTEKEEGPAHDKTFTVSVCFDGVKLGTGTGKSKKDAEQIAAREALAKMVKA